MRDREIDAQGFFILSDEEIDQIMECCKPLPNDITVQVDPASFVGIASSDGSTGEQANSNSQTMQSQTSAQSQEAFDQHFICRICQMVVLDAEECGKCQNCFCSKCIKQWQKVSTNYKLADAPSSSLVSEYGERRLVVTCPMCKEGYTGTPLHRYLKNKLNSFLFKCESCDSEQPLPYEKYIAHQTTSCPNVKVPCPLRCESMVQEPGKKHLFSRGQELKSHLKQDCPNMSVTCAKCDAEVAVRLKQSHDCVKALRGVIAQYAKIISSQQEMIEKLTAGYAAAAMFQQDDQSMISQTGASTQFESEYQAVNANGANGQDFGYQRRTYPNPFRIPGSSDTDLSNTSILQSMRTSIQHEESPIPARDPRTDRSFLNLRSDTLSSAAQIPTFQNKCPQGHDLRADVHSDAANSDQVSPAQSQPHQRCSGCGSQIASAGFIWRCRESCDFKLCDNCRFGR